MKYIIVLLFSIGLSAQEFDFECKVYLTADDYSDITLDTEGWEYYKLFTDDLYSQTGRDLRYLVREEFTIRSFTPPYTSGAAFIGSENGRVRFSYSYGGYGLAIGACNNSLVHVQVGIENWEQLEIQQRLWLMYHELGHDLLDLAHIEEFNGTFEILQDENGESYIGNYDGFEVMYQGAVGGIRNMEMFIEGKTKMFNGINAVALCN